MAYGKEEFKRKRKILANRAQKRLRPVHRPPGISNHTAHRERQIAREIKKQQERREREERESV